MELLSEAIINEYHIKFLKILFGKLNELTIFINENNKINLPEFYLSDSSQYGVDKINNIIDFINQKHQSKINLTSIYTSKQEAIDIINKIILLEKTRETKK